MFAQYPMTSLSAYQELQYVRYLLLGMQASQAPFVMYTVLNIVTENVPMNDPAKASSPLEKGHDALPCFDAFST